MSALFGEIGPLGVVVGISAAALWAGTIVYAWAWSEGWRLMWVRKDGWRR